MRSHPLRTRDAQRPRPASPPAAGPVRTVLSALARWSRASRAPRALPAAFALLLGGCLVPSCGAVQPGGAFGGQVGWGDGPVALPAHGTRPSIWEKGADKYDLAPVLCGSAPRGPNDEEPTASGPFGVEVVGVFRQPVAMASAPGDPRLYIAEQDGFVRVLLDGVVQPEPLLDLSQVVSRSSLEQGLLGLAFHPEYLDNGRVFAAWSEGGTHVLNVSEWHADPRAALVDPASHRRLLRIALDAGYHQGGGLAFGPYDGLLYVSVGDGSGSGGDPGGYSRDPGALPASLLRIDVDAVPNLGRDYVVPPSNPWFGVVDARGEVFAKGLRNPWRFSFDRITGDLWIGDVGDETAEEINLWQAGRPGRPDFGWNVFEGAACYHAADPAACESIDATPPLVEWGQSGTGCAAVTGGAVYRGSCMPELEGTYFFADYCQGWVRSLRDPGDGAGYAAKLAGQGAGQDDVVDGFDSTDWTSVLEAQVQSIHGIASFGEDAWGELYLVNHATGEVSRLVGGGR